MEYAECIITQYDVIAEYSLKIYILSHVVVLTEELAICHMSTVDWMLSPECIIMNEKNVTPMLVFYFFLT